MTSPQLEKSQTAMNEAGLKEIAAASGGAFFQGRRLVQIARSVQVQTDPAAVYDGTSICGQPRRCWDC